MIRIARAWIVCITALAFAASPAFAVTTRSARDALSVPAPTGAYAIGAVSLHLIDRDRSDPLAPTRSRRALMVTVWYPARNTAAAPAAYLETRAARVIDGEMDVAPGTFESARSHARSAAPVVRPAKPGYPAVLYSPGFGSWRNADTALTEELVSHGFVVVTIDHPYDGIAVEFPNGRVVRSRPLTPPAGTTALTYDAWNSMVQTALTVRVADVRFVISVLGALNAGRNPDVERRPLPAHLAGALNLQEIGMYGHSLGGATAAQVLRTLPSVRAGMSLDGPIPKATATRCAKQPFVLLRSVNPALRRLTVPSWTASVHMLCGPHRLTALSGSGHNDFTDLTVFAHQLALGEAQRTVWSLGSVDSRHAIEFERGELLNFFDRWLEASHRR